MTENKKLSVVDSINIFCALTKTTKKQIASKIGMPYQTFLIKQRNPSTFRLDELQRIAKVLKVDTNELGGWIA